MTTDVKVNQKEEGTVMNIRHSSRIFRTISAAILFSSLAIGTLGGLGAAHAAPVETGFGNDCIGSSTNEPLPRAPEGTVETFLGRKQICVQGQWVDCSNPSLTPSLRAACAAGLTAGRTGFTFTRQVVKVARLSR